MKINNVDYGKITDTKDVCEEYLIFGGSKHYASGGINDLIGARFDLEDAIKLAESVFGKEIQAMKIDDWDRENTLTMNIEIKWVQIFESSSGNIVFSKGEAFGGDTHAIVKTDNQGFSPVLAEK